MTTDMGPPPPRNPNQSSNSETKPVDEVASSSGAAAATMNSAMGPPPPRNLSTSNPNSDQSSMDVEEAQPQSDSTSVSAAESMEKNPESSVPDTSAKPKPKSSQNIEVPYKIPPWSGAPCHNYCLEVLKDGCIIEKLDVYEKGAYMFGRLDLCDFLLEHPTISRFHAVIQFKRSGDAYLYDLGSTHGTFLNKKQVEKNMYMDLHVGDVIRFGRSSRLFIFQGPSDLMLPETDLKIMKQVKMREQMLDREASLQRARMEAALVDGISWGMGEDAIEEEEDYGDEVTWQSYKGQLTEKQEKTKGKLLKRMEKIANMKKEISAIRGKDISQGGLTQGQQTQIARNEQRMMQIMEELENLEETLNDSIRESIGARSGKKSHGKKKGEMEDEEEYLSDDDDEFYDRTKKMASSQKPGDSQSIETADTLLDKRDAIIKEINDKIEVLSVENSKMASETSVQDEGGDALDAYMSGVSSQLVHDKTVQLEKELSSLQSELDRISYLLKIADPTGEAAKKRELKSQEPKPKKSEEAAPVIKKKPPPRETQKNNEPSAKADGPIQGEKTADATVGLEKSEGDPDRVEAEKVVYTVAKPQWLGAVEGRVTDDNQQVAATMNKNEMDENDQFIDYNDRSKILTSGDDAKTGGQSNIESAAPGLILRKPKQVEKTETTDHGAPQQLTSSAEDAVALLLKHKRGYYTTEDDQDASEANGSIKDKKKPRKVLGPEKPSFLSSGSSNTDYESWVPPQGQSGDGRTSLNDKYGY
ncbi:hypothetical protein L6164_006603 [Bauhinia variegata]|uniref:Uncharacterized protein n=1 Tax=Bauhinia variegata TaxID=167791 RepID=A0ACB9Q0D8_BAUVA|nr:hypothetical protein L6164_006603 [Bauhinia variegata]